MADDTPDLISNISVTGGDDVVNALQNVGDKGGAALDKLATSADNAAQAIKGSSTEIQNSLGAISNAAPNTATADRLASIEAAANKLGSTVRSSVGDLASFGAKIAALGTVAAGAVVGFAKFAQSITQATRPPIDTTEELTRQLEQLNKQGARNVTGAVQYDNSLQALNRQVNAGTLNYKDYNTEIIKLNQSFKDQQRAHEALQEAMRESLKENQELQIQASQREAYNALANTYGTVLTGSLIKLGAQSLDVSHQLRDAFGPVISSLVEKLVDLINRNSGTITKFINTTSKALQDFIDKSGPSIDNIASKITDFGKSTLQVINSIIIPAFNGFMSILDKVAQVINGVFGTNIDSTGLLVVAVVLQLTGGFTALFSIISAGAALFGVLVTVLGGPIAIAVVALTVLLVALYNAVDWKALGTQIQNTFTTLKNAGSEAINAVLGFFTAFPTNLAIVWQAIVDGANAVWQQITQGASDLLQSATNVVNQIVSAFQQGWSQITSFATNAYNTISNYLTDLVNKVMKFLGLQAQAASASSSGSSSDASQSFSSGGHVVGAGSWTSDSIPAWLSNHEFVMQARAVAKYGVSFMKAINSGALDIGSAIQGFAAGGLVTPGISAPRFALGGAVNKSNRILNLTIGGEAFNGLQMPEAVADKMSKFAVAKQVSSAGRKPSWIGGPK